MFATFFVTTGRCGTQWLHEVLGDVYADLAIVTHEPLWGIEYQARTLLWRGDVPNLANPAPIVEHVARIADMLPHKRYIETGGFCRGAFPYLVDSLGPDTHIVHLVRHPIPTAISYRKAHLGMMHAVQGNASVKRALSPRPEPPPFTRRVQPSSVEGPGTLGQTPFDRGSKFSEYCDRWRDLSPLDRELYRWLEINACAIDYQRRATCPWLRVKYEELFTEEGLRRLIAFLELPPRPGIQERLLSRVDKFGHVDPPVGDPVDLDRHPRILALISELGYSRVSPP